MATETVMGLKLDPQIGERVRRLASSRHWTPEAIVQDAVEEYVSKAEGQAEFRLATLAAAEHYRATGLHLTQEEVEEWADQLEAGEEVPMPACHV